MLALVAANTAQLQPEALKADDVSRPNQVLKAEDIARPRILGANRCGGSTWVQSTARALLSAHGLVHWNGPFEFWDLIYPKTQPWKKESSSQGEFERVFTMAGRNNSALALKIEPDDPSWAREILRNKGAQVILTTRENPLDNLICNVKDCFDPSKSGNDWGFPVNATTGEQSSLCFGARHLPKSVAQPKVLLHTANLSAALAEYDAQLNRTVATWVQDGFASDNLPVVTLEDLSVFQYKDDLDTGSVSEVSIAAWSKVMTAFGIKPDRATITDLLRPMAQTVPPHSTADAVYNIEEVTSELERLNRTDLLNHHAAAAG